MIKGMIFYKPHSGICYGSLGNMLYDDFISMLSAALKGSISIIGEEITINNKMAYLKRIDLEDISINVYNMNNHYYAHKQDNEFIHLLQSQNLESIVFTKPSYNLKTKKLFIKEYLQEKIISLELIYNDKWINNVIRKFINNKDIDDNNLRRLLVKGSSLYDELNFNNRSLSFDSLKYVINYEYEQSKEIHNFISKLLVLINNKWDVINELFNVLDNFDINKKEIIDYLSLINNRQTNFLDSYFLFKNGYILKT